MNNANLIKILIVFTLFMFAKLSIYGQETDPINQALNNEKKELEGFTLYPHEQKEIDRINKKYELSDKEKAARLKHESGQKLSLFNKYRIGKSNRKAYLLKKKTEKFNKKLILNRQNEQTRKRMIENDKRIKARDKKIKRKQRQKRFFNLFR